MPYHFPPPPQIPENSCRWRIGWISRILHGGRSSDSGQLGDEINAEVRCMLMFGEGCRNFRDFQNWLWREVVLLAGRRDECMTILGFGGLRHKGK